MKTAAAFAALVLTLGLTAAFDADAKRLGSSRNSGMQRSQPTQPATSPAAQPGTPATPATAAPATAAAATAPAAAAAATKRSWAAPLAGLAAGLGLAALASHLGLGEAFGNIMLMVLAAIVVMAIVGFVLRKRAMGNAAPALAGAGAGMQRSGSFDGQPGAGSSGGGVGSTRIGSAVAPAASSTGVQGRIPADFDAASFALNAKSQFMALQQANDARDLDRLREYLTPAMFEVVRDEVAARGNEPQRTEVFGLDARVLDVADEPQQYVVSVRFTGSTRERATEVPQDLDEIWHLTKPRDGAGGWVVAGIQQFTPEAGAQ